MNRKTTFLTLAFMVLLAAACDRLGSPNLDVQTFTLEHRSGYEAAELIEPYVFGDRQEAPGALNATHEALTVRETRDNLEKIGRVLEEFDQPIPGIRLRFQLIQADSFQERDPAIADVVDELESLFQFEGYRLLGEAIAPVAGGTMAGENFSQRFLGVGNPITVEARAFVTASGTVRLDPVQLSDRFETLMEATVSITPGQTIVIGGTQTYRDQQSVLIMTVRAELE